MTGLEIAVIGMAGRFPGAKNIDEFWNNLKNGIETISFFSHEELEANGIHPDLLNNPDYVKANGVLENIQYFDPFFFDYTKPEGELMDPQVRIFHECAWKALEDAGCDPQSYPGLIGLYAGAAANFNWEAMARLSAKSRMYGAFASVQLTRRDMMCLRVAYKLNLKGPVVPIYTACSTSLVAIHLGCQGLLSGECDMALVGGVTISLPQAAGYLYQEGMIHSPDGHCWAFDAQAKGTISGNGVGVVVLKRLNDAVADRDHVYAVIKGSAINNDGNRKVGFTAPSIKGQVEVIRAAQQMADVEPESISYIEAHGTGTIIGDPIEVKALIQAFKTNKKKFCGIGSIKTNIGHLDAAAGAAGFIKTILGLNHRLIPPSLHFKTPNPEFDIENSPFYVVSDLTLWKNGKHPLRAGVSSLGIGGTNAHVVLEEWPNTQGAGRKVHRAQRKSSEQFSSSRQYQLILLSARTSTALERASINLAHHLKKNPGINLADAAYTLQVGRRAFSHRRMLVCSTDGSDLDQAAKNLDSPQKQSLHQSDNPVKIQTFFSNEENQDVIFMFPGQGAQYVNMGRELYETEPVFREEMDRCFEILKPIMGYDIKEILYPGDSVSTVSEVNRYDSARLSDPGDSPLERGAPQGRGVSQPATYNLDPLPDINQTEVTQPILFIFEYALAVMLMKWGIKPHAMIGHSIGEYVAACLAKIFSLEDALKMVVIRGRLMQQMPKGAMLSVSLPEEKLQPLLPSNEKISLAAVNSPQLCVVSGPHDAVNDFSLQLKEKEIESKPLHTSHAFHSKMMVPLLEPFGNIVKQIKFSKDKPKIPYISNLTGTVIAVEQASEPGYWVKHLEETVKFSQGVKELLNLGNPVFMEVGPGRTLSTLVKQHMNQEYHQNKGNGNHKPKNKKNTPSQLAVNLVRHPKEDVSDTYYLLSKIGQLWLYGVRIDWQQFHSNENRCRISLPTYSFDCTYCWLDGSGVGANINMEQLVGKPQSPGMEGSPPNEEPECESPEESDQRLGLSTPYKAPETETEKILTGIWLKFFGIDQPGIDDDFFQLGGDSLQAMIIVNTIHETVQVKIPMDVFFSRPNIRELADYIENQSQKDMYAYLEPVEKMEYYPLSPMQETILLVHKMNPNNIIYNISFAMELTLNIDKSILVETFGKLIKRHESLRTSFEAIEEKTLQRVHNDVDFDVEYFEPEENRQESVKRITKNFIRPFDLGKAPLLRVGLIKIIDSEGIRYIMTLDMHHIISDGTSGNIIIRNLKTLAQDEKLPRLRIQYKDYTVWYNKQMESGLIKRQEKYWMKRFEKGPPLLNLPTDYERPLQRSHESDFLYFEIESEKLDKLKDLVKSENVTLMMVFMCIYYIFLSKLTGQEDIAIAAPVNGRNHSHLEQVIGMFAKTLYFRNYPQSEKIFIEFLKDVRASTLEAYENQDYPPDALTSVITINRQPGRNPITDLGFSLLQVEEIKEDAKPSAPASRVAAYNLGKTDMMGADLTLLVVQKGNSISFRLAYLTKLFKRETMKRFAEYYKNIIDVVIENRNIQLKHIRLSHDLLEADTHITDVDFDL